MATPTIDQRASSLSTGVANAIVDTVRKAADVSHKAQLLKTLAEDTVEDRIHAAKRAVTRGVRRATDVRDTAAYRVKRQPLKSVSVAFGGGVLLGACVGWFAQRACRRR